MSEITDRIKEKIDIVEFLKNYLELKPAGKNYRALCPFHKEKTPSFMISPDRQSWHCFGGCNEGGDIFGFIMKYENLEFYEALKFLAEKAGIEIKKIQGIASDYQQYGILYEVNEAAKNFWAKLLYSSTDAFEYLLERGLKKEIIKEFELGYAVEGEKDLLVRHLIGLGFNIKDIERAGLAFKTERGTYWDRFRGRIMFPICNSFGKVVGFTGRLLPASSDAPIKDGLQSAKYVNSPETPIFNKSKILYGLHKAKKHIRDQQLALLVEGQMDFLMAYQDNIKNVVAVSGTALTPDHLRILRKMSDKLILSFDSDEAGQLAAERSIDLAAASDFLVKVLTIASGKDPAEIVKRQSGELIKIIASAQSASDFYFNRYLTSSQKFHEKKSGIRIILTKVKNIFSDIERAVWLKELSAKTGISETALMAEMEKIPTNQQSNKTPEPRRSFDDQKREPDNNWSRRQFIVQRILDLGGQLPEGVELLKNDDDQLALKASLENSRIDLSRKEIELKNLLKWLKLELIKEKQQQLKIEIASAERENRQEELHKALKKFDLISKESHNLTNYNDEA